MAARLHANDAMTRMLVVDDDAQIRALLQHVGERCGFEVDTARDGVDAVELLNANRYAVALIDLMMPRLSGYEILEQRNGTAGRPKFIVVTAMTDEYIARITADLADAIVRKPFDVGMLTSIIRAVTATMAASAHGERASRPQSPGVPPGDCPRET